MSIIDDFYTPVSFLRDSGGGNYNKSTSAKKLGTDTLSAFNRVCEEVISKANLPKSVVLDPDNQWLDGSNVKYREYLWYRIKASIYEDYSVSVSIFADKKRTNPKNSNDQYEQGYRVELEFHESIKGKHQEVNDKHTENFINFMNTTSAYISNGYLQMDKTNYEFGNALRKWFPVSDADINNLDENVVNNIIDDLADCVTELYEDMQKEIYIYNSVVGCKLQELILKGHKQIVLTGAPGTGKTYSAREFVKTDLGKQYDKFHKGKTTKTREEWVDEHYKMVQFHPSYDYTDFVEGLRPVQVKDNNTTVTTTTFKRMDGTFKEFCRKVEAEGKKENRYFIIDEINRADLSKVFGELMFCLEKSYRGKENKIPTQYKNLPTYEIDNGTVKEIVKDCFAEGFYIPENIVIIGTMNDIDRSVDTFDYALRRRFKWINVEVNEVLLMTTFEQMIEKKSGNTSASNTPSGSTPISKDNMERYASQICEMNEVFTRKEFARVFRSPIDYYVGPSYFEDLLFGKSLTDIWEDSVKPLLREYVRGRDIADEFIETCECSLLSGASETTYALLNISKKINLNCKNWSEDDRAKNIEVVLKLLAVIDNYSELFNKNTVSRSSLYKADKLLCTKSGEPGKFNPFFNDDNNWSDKVFLNYTNYYNKNADAAKKKAFSDDWKKAIDEWNQN